MNRYLAIAVATLVLVLPATVFAAAGLKNSKHDLSFGSTAVVKASGATDTQTCIFCHTPHKSLTQALIWNHKASGTVAFGFTAGFTAAGTVLPTTAANPITAASKKCMDCHDGSVAVGDVANAGGGAAGVIAVINDANTTLGKMNAAGAYTVGFGGNMDNNHPVSIPYAGKGTAIYNGITSSAVADANPGNYFTVATGAACTSPSGVCTTAVTNGAKINLYGTSAATAGIECGSCHAVHDDTNGFFLRVSNAGSALCLACHNK